MSAYCVACEGEKDDDWMICEYCQLFTAKRLREIPKLHGLLAADDWLKMPQKIESERPQRSTSGGAPANLHVLSLLDRRTDIRSVLTPWVEEFNERLDFKTPPPADVKGLCDRVITLMDWWAAKHPAAGDLVHEVKRGHDMLVQIANGSRRPPSKIPCPVVFPDDSTCEGTLTLRKDGSVRCEGCLFVWTREQWHALTPPIAH